MRFCLSERLHFEFVENTGKLRVYNVKDPLNAVLEISLIAFALDR